MSSSTEDVYKFLELVRRRISNKFVIKERNSDQIILRSDIKTSTEACLFVGEYGALTHSRFRATLNSRGRIFSTPGMKWICTYRRMNADTLKMSPKCPATINIVIKKVTKFSKMKDADLAGSNPMRALIKISPIHNHIVEDPCSDRFLRVSGPVKECFFEYFKRGILGTKAKLFHEQNLRKANFIELNDESMNPSLRAIIALYRQWKKLMENVQLNKVSIPEVSETVQQMNVPTDNVAQFTPDSSQIVCKCEVDPVDDNYFAEIQNEVLQSFNGTEDVKPVFNIKKEIDEDTGLPVIESYGSVAAAPATNSTSVRRVGSANTQVVVYEKSSNTFKVIKYLSVGTKYSSTHHSSSQYNTYLPRTLLPPRVALHI